MSYLKPYEVICGDKLASIIISLRRLLPGWAYQITQSTRTNRSPVSVKLSPTTYCLLLADRLKISDEPLHTFHCKSISQIKDMVGYTIRHAEEYRIKNFLANESSDPSAAQVVREVSDFTFRVFMKSFEDIRNHLAYISNDCNLVELSFGWGVDITGKSAEDKFSLSLDFEKNGKSFTIDHIGELRTVVDAVLTKIGSL